MPYIEQERRELVRPEYPERDPITAGEFNFALTTLVRNYLEGGYNYQVLNDVIGALECAKLECYRRVAAPYEDKKIVENGDVY